MIVKGWYSLGSYTFLIYFFFIYLSKFNQKIETYCMVTINMIYRITRISGWFCGPDRNRQTSTPLFLFEWTEVLELARWVHIPLSYISAQDDSGISLKTLREVLSLTLPSYGRQYSTTVWKDPRWSTEMVSREWETKYLLIVFEKFFCVSFFSFIKI